jgi:hypothetical protein
VFLAGSRFFSLVVGGGVYVFFLVGGQCGGVDVFFLLVVSTMVSTVDDGVDDSTMVVVVGVV